MAARFSSSREHTDRLFASAEMLDMAIPYTVEEIDEACRETLRRQGFSDAYVRPIAWRGSEMMGVSGQANRINVAIAIWQWPAYFDPAQLEKGIKLDIAEWRRPDPRTAPSKAKAVGLYMICTLSKHAAERKGYADALMYDWRGQVAECTGANIFFVRNGELHTPDARLLPRRDHPADRHRPRPAAAGQGQRAGHHARGACRLRAVLHRRDRGGGHAGGRDRAAPLQRGRSGAGAQGRLPVGGSTQGSSSVGNGAFRSGTREAFA